MSLIIKTALTVAFVGMGLIFPSSTFASWDPGNIISDGEFRDYNSMSRAQIQSFLEKQNSFLANPSDAFLGSKVFTGGRTIFGGLTPEAIANNKYKPSDIIYLAAQEYRVNPKFILVLMKREQPLQFKSTTDNYSAAFSVGYACFENTGCQDSSSNYGFSAQIDGAAWQFNNYVDNMQLYWPAYLPGKTIRLDDGSVTLKTRATGGLYIYTPHIYAGNFNFFNFYNEWFPPFELNLTGGYFSNPNSWDSSKTKFVESGDINGDGESDLVALYDYGNKRVGLWTFYGDGTTYRPHLSYLSNEGQWNFSSIIQIATGDLHNDGMVDVSLMYDYGNNNMGIWVFKAQSNEDFLPHLTYLTGANTWSASRSKFMNMGDYNGDNRADILIAYEYQNKKMGLWTFVSDGINLTPSIKYLSQENQWDMNRIRFLKSGNYDGSGRDYVSIIYDYGEGKMGIWVFDGTGQPMEPRLAYKTLNYQWNISSTKFVTSGDIDKDGAADIQMVYYYGGTRMGVWTYYSNRTSFVPNLSYYSDSWYIDSTKFSVFTKDNTPGSLNGLNFIYDYGYNNMGILGIH